MDEVSFSLYNVTLNIIINTLLMKKQLQSHIDTEPITDHKPSYHQILYFGYNIQTS